jgi:hypothetical protein
LVKNFGKAGNWQFTCAHTDLKLFGGASLMEILVAVQKAVPVFHEHKDSTWKTLGEALEEAGIPKTISTRLLEFMPLAFARAFVDGLGIEFGEYYIRFDSKTNRKVSKKLMDEPVYSESLSFATSLMAEQRAGDEFISVVIRSSEFVAMNKAMNDGSHPEDLVSSPPILLWDEESDNRTDAAGQAKSRWKFWK